MLQEDARCAHCSRKVDEQAARLSSAVEQHGVLANIADDAMLPQGWDSLPMVYVVERNRAAAVRCGAVGGWAAATGASAHGEAL